jgi:hypothetical protein
MAGFFHSYISWYIQIADPLKDWKHTLLKPGPTMGKVQKNFTKAVHVIVPTQDKLIAFQML